MPNGNIGPDLAKAIADQIEEDFKEPQALKTARRLFGSGVTEDKMQYVRNNTDLSYDIGIQVQGHIRGLEKGIIK